MKIALVCSHGGHLTEILYLLKNLPKYEYFFITYKSNRTKELAYPKYLLDNIGISPFKMMVSFIKIFKILFKERPDLILSTGSEIAIPTFYLSKIFKIKAIYIESWCRVTSPSCTGKLVYPVSKLFLVQWPQMLKCYGKRVKYEGGLI